ncbi:SDR family NAD(P)-dependent oxidoreductase [Saccharopolyspora sp. ASAGF58]|uniref:SDR family NAD(P)-dependent oxidoreductase n=1 Tax=Saccharopolyspora sp. ASAGF58 TaxID=2719023 RepID=UPI00143FC8C1|nr:SDR family oxidoreductase [Saccharopolyspora sp. ASAGF58]QIZ37781.1 SDR family oxidoreductase [Saccharopolyspora sp. ASAGF58]
MLVNLVENKVVIVTGAAGGIGVAIAEDLFAEGAVVVATARKKQQVEELAAKHDDPRWQVVELDVTDAGGFSRLVDNTVAQHGRLDGLVNNAGVLAPNDVPSSSVAEYDFHFDVNVKGVYLGCKYAIPAMLASGGGSIVNFGSINSLAAEPQLALYTASKGAVLMLTKAIALDHAAQGIRANTLCPGFVDTPLNVPHYTKLGGREALEEGLPSFQPIGRPIEPREIAQPVTFLISDASSAMTGTAFVVDGGVLCKA